MLEMIAANWIVFALALLLGLIVAWWIFARGSSVGSQRERKPDALDEGVAPASRNQALIDAPPAADLTPMVGGAAMAGLAEIVAVGAQDQVEDKALREMQEPAGHQPVATPAAPEPTPQPVASTVAGDPDDLRRIKGVGPKLAALLHSLGVTGFAQIASWDEAEIDRVDAQLGTFAGRIRRDNWVEQARLLQDGDTAAYEAKFGKL